MKIAIAHQTVEMEIKQQNTNTTYNTKKNIHKWLSSTSMDLLNHYRFDRPNKLDIPRYLITNAMLSVLCSDLECDIDVDDCLLEKINLYVEKRV